MAGEKLSFEKIFSDEMVLPQSKNFKIAGNAESGEKVKVEIGGISKKTSADSDGHWFVEFPSMEGTESVVAKTNTDNVSIHNVHFGKVYLMAGQSNVEYKLRDDLEYQAILDKFKSQNAYFINVPQVEFVNEDGSVIPDNLPEEKWQQVSKKTIGEMSAVGFYMLQQLIHEFPQQTIGIVDCYKGGTSASSWISKNALEKDSELKQTFTVPFKQQTVGKSDEDFKKELVDYQKSVGVHNTKLGEYLKKYPDASLSVAKDTVGHTPWPPPMTPKSYLRPNGLYETMVVGIKNYTFNDVVWYQGENDAPNPEVYEKLLKVLLQNWRELFQDQPLPFYIVQLPVYADEPKDAWAKIRQAQLNTVESVPYTHLISITDTGEEHNIHPSSKRKAGTRIGKIISGLQYSSTPYVKRVDVHDQQLILTVSHATDLHIVEPLGLEVLVEGVWRAQRVQKIIGNKIFVEFSNKTTAIRYAYKNFSKLAVFNENNFPVSPFELRLGK
ncbi:sialate O-acetylesterase [Pediococcus inopinatus]|uniref:sialate O-acetylesterase n=1 Tax=Pediococcus inopinatus TaxID=114090 RepID=UPI002B260A1F|nr:sialate O-acetylesterase [Pediococcus inopinatus]WPC18314.1 sialate O-acetylesterase [Pediococcus inopinatus]